MLRIRSCGGARVESTRGLCGNRMFLAFCCGAQKEIGTRLKMGVDKKVEIKERTFSRLKMGVDKKVEIKERTF